nr:hypothetical protein [Tanacetum cinerariifolium]
MKDDERVSNVDLSICWSLKIKFEKTTPPGAPCRIAAVWTRDHKYHHDDDNHPKGESSAKRHNMYDHGTYSSVESSSEQVMEESNLSVSAQLQKVVNQMLRARCSYKEEHQFHLDQMHNYLKSDIVSESKKEDLSVQILKKPALVYQSCQGDPKAPEVTLLNQDLFYLKYARHGNLSKNVNLTATTITFLGIERKKLLTITLKPKVGLIYENNKKEKNVMIFK